MICSIFFTLCCLVVGVLYILAFISVKKRNKTVPIIALTKSQNHSKSLKDKEKRKLELQLSVIGFSTFVVMLVFVVFLWFFVFLLVMGFEPGKLNFYSVISDLYCWLNPWILLCNRKIRNHFWNFLSCKPYNNNVNIV